MSYGASAGYSATNIDATSSGVSSSRAVATDEERALNNLMLQSSKSNIPLTTQTQQNALSLINQLLAGNTLPGLFANAGGISQNQIDEMAGKAASDVLPGMQSLGLADSGAAAELAAKTSAGVRSDAAQFNSNQALNLLNTAMAGQTQAQAPVLSASESLGARLEGLRTIYSAAINKTRTTAGSQSLTAGFSG